MNTTQRSTLDRLNDMGCLPSEILWCEDEIQRLGMQSGFDEVIALINERKDKCEAELQWCIDLIASTEAKDPMLYQILCLRFVEGLNWVKTALQLPMKYSGDACRQRVYRWLATLDV